MIYSILLISKGGVPIYKKVLRRLPVAEEKMDEESLVASIITAVIGMSQEVFGQRISSFHLENLEVSIGSSEKAIVAVISDKGDKEAVELGRNILVKIDKILDFPDFEDGLILSSVSDRIEEFINSLMEEISSPLTKSSTLLEDFLLLMEREQYYEPINKGEIAVYNPPKNIFGVLKAKILKKEKEIIEAVIEQLKNPDLKTIFDTLTEAFNNSYWGNLAKLLFVKLGLIANTLRHDIPAPSLDTLLSILSDVKTEDFKTKGKTDQFEKLLILKDYLYKQLDNLNTLDGLSMETHYFQAIKNEARTILSKTEDELERKIIILLLTPISTSPAILSIIDKEWNEISDYFVEIWFMLDRIDLFKNIDYWEDLFNRINDLNRLYYKMKRWSSLAAISTLPMFFDVILKIRTVKDIDLGYLKEILSNLNDFWLNEVLPTLENPMIPTHLIVFGVTIGSLINAYLLTLESEEKIQERLEIIKTTLVEWLKKINHDYLGRRMYPDVMFTVAPQLIYSFAIINSFMDEPIREIFHIFEDYIPEIKKRISTEERTKLGSIHIESLGFVLSSLPHFLKFVKNRIDSERILTRGAELVEYIKTRLDTFKSLDKSKVFIGPIINYYTSIVKITREKSLADLVLLRAITMSEDIKDRDYNRFIVARMLLDLYYQYIIKFGPIVPNWQKPIKECEKSMQLLRELKSPEEIIANVWKRCHDFKKLVASN